MPDTVSYINYFTNYTDVRKSLFLGGKVGLIENLRKEFPVIWDLYKQLKSLDWDENEIDITPCRLEFKEHPEEITQLMIKTLAWQFEADSSAAHIAPLMMPFVNNAEIICYLTRLADNECLTPDHEVLTPNGWIPINQVKIDTKVAQWEYGTFNISFVNPTNIINKHHEGSVYHIYNQHNNFNQVVTPNHRLPLIYPYWTNSGEIKEFDYAESINLHGGNGLPTAGIINKHGRGMTPQERLYLAVQADGSLCGEKYDGTRSGFKHYKFGLKRDDKIQRLEYLCNLAGWRINEVNLKRTEVDGHRSFYVYVPLDQYNEQAKTFDWFSLDEVTYEWCCDFIDELKYWDGNITQSGNIRYTSTNKSAIDKASTIGHLIGLRGHITVIHPRENVLMPGGHFSDTKESYQVHFCDRNYVVGNGMSKMELWYEGPVHCLSVPSSYFLVRRNNCISITGNCLHSLAYKVIVESSFDDPEEFIKELLSIEESFERLSAVKKVFDETYNIGLKYGLKQITDEHQIKKTIFKFWVTLLALERIQFVASFAITFGLAELGYYVPIAKLVQKIATDEFQIHVQADKAIIQNELNIEENFSAYLDSLDDINLILKEVVDSELTWLDFLFGDKEDILGMRKNRLRDFVIYSATEVYKFLGIENPYGDILENPLPYMNKWLVIDSNQSSPQEESVANYLLGGFTDDAHNFNIAEYQLRF